MLAVRAHGNVVYGRCDRGRLLPHPDALARFRKYCQFDPTTGCVLWVGGTTSGRGHSSPYGSFWYGGRRWFAHRWAAEHIYGLAIDGRQVDHCCEPYRAGHNAPPLPPNTLCVHHVQALAGSENRSLQDERRTWILTQKGYYDSPPAYVELEAPAPAMPLYDPPAWLRVDSPVNARAGCPF